MANGPFTSADGGQLPRRLYRFPQTPPSSGAYFVPARNFGPAVPSAYPHFSYPGTPSPVQMVQESPDIHSYMISNYLHGTQFSSQNMQGFHENPDLEHRPDFPNTLPFQFSADQIHPVAKPEKIRFQDEGDEEEPPNRGLQHRLIVTEFSDLKEDLKDKLEKEYNELSLKEFKEKANDILQQFYKDSNAFATSAKSKVDLVIKRGEIDEDQGQALKDIISKELYANLKDFEEKMLGKLVSLIASAMNGKSITYATSSKYDSIKIDTKVNGEFPVDNQEIGKCSKHQTVKNKHGEFMDCVPYNKTPAFGNCPRMESPVIKTGNEEGISASEYLKGLVSKTIECTFPNSGEVSLDCIRIATLLYILAGNIMYGDEFVEQYPGGIVVGPFTVWNVPEDKKSPELDNRMEKAKIDDREVWPWGFRGGDEGDLETGAIVFVGGDATVYLGEGKFLTPPVERGEGKLRIMDREEIKGQVRGVIVPNPKKYE